MKNFKNFALWFLFLIFLGLVGYYSVYNYMFKDSYDLINISYLSEDFMDDYFEEISNTNSSDKENMLIVISKKGISNDYGALNVIEAPNNQYILEYSDSVSKDYALEMLENDSSIESVDENSVYHTEEADVSYNSWGIKKMGLNNVIENDSISNLSSVVVAIIDTGCDIGLFNKYYAGKLAGTYNVLQGSDSIMEDEHGHGTHVAGTIAEGTTSNVKILPIKVSTDGHMYYTDIIAAINYIVYNKSADVINMSFGGYTYSESLDQAIESAKEANIISVAAAGNDSSTKMHYPSSLDNTISIGSVVAELKLSSFSNYGSTLSFVAPGSSINSIMSSDSSLASDDGDDDHEVLSGTSMATPHAVSAVAILKGFNKDLTFDKVMDILKDNAVDLGDPGWDEYYGYGFISFNNIDFCDGTNCDDEYGIYIDETKNYKSIEVTDIVFTNYNYYSLTNILGTNVKITYNDDSSEIVTLDKLDNVTISNYDPYSSEEQEVVINLYSISTTMKITNPSDYQNGWLYNLLDDGTYEITGYYDNKLNSTKLYVPEKLPDSDGSYKNVSSFADMTDVDSAFSQKNDDFKYYTSLYLPSSFTRIGNYSLSNSNIKYIYGNDNKLEAGAYSFYNSKIISIDVPFTKIEEFSFRDSYDLETIEVWQNKSYDLVIGEYAFYNCNNLISITMSSDSKFNSIGNIGDYAFYNCVSLSNFGLVAAFNIGDYAFYNTINLYTIDLYQADSIGKFAFYGSSISEAKFGIHLTSINESSFENCKNLKSVSFGSGRIEKRAFWNSGVETIGISNSTEYISEDAFAYSPVRKYGGLVSEGAYITVSGSGIVESSTNKLIVGVASYNNKDYVSISSDITEIGEYAFTGNDYLNNVAIPSSVTKIGTHSFEDCYNLENIYMLGNDLEIDNQSFKKNYDGEIKNKELMFYVYKNSKIKEYAVNNDIKYRHIDPDEYEVINLKDKYTAGSYLTSDNVPKVKLIYHENEVREEIISQDDGSTTGPVTSGFLFEFDYQNRGSVLKYGDTYIKITVRNSVGYIVCNDEVININVVKATPTYTIPTDLTAEFGQKLSDIVLPSGFEWMDSNQVINESGNVIYKARYVPSDTDNYEIIENIDINILVSCSKEIISPSITISDKIYDGDSSILESNINISNLDSNDYTIENISSDGINVGEYTALIKIKLSDDKFVDYIFDNGLQEKEFNIKYNIVKADINLVDNSKDVNVKYDGELHNINIDINCNLNYIIKYMDSNKEYTLDDIPKYSDVGEYTIKYMVMIDDNYNKYYGEKKLKIENNFSYKINNYEVDETNKYIDLIDINTSVDDFKKNIDLNDSYTVKVDYKSVNGKKLIYTGGKTKIYKNNELYAEYTNIIRGDVNGNAVIDIIDYIRIMKDIMDVTKLTDVYVKAADVNQNGKIDIIDYIRVMKMIMEEN